MRFLIAAALLLISLNAGSTFNVIAHPSETNWTITMQDLRYIYSLNKQYWSTGESIRPVRYGWSDPVHLEFVRNFLNVSPKRLRSIVEQRVNSGLGIGHLVAYGGADMINKVRSTKGAIGYGSSYMMVPHDGSVRIVRIVP